MYLGSALNLIVMAANHGQMPVLFPGSCSVDIFSADIFHVCMTGATHLKFLSDWLVIKGLGVASIGDLLIWLSDAITTPALYLWGAMMVMDSNLKSRF